MTKPEYLDELIERASKAAGNDNKLAQLLEVNRSAVSDWKHGRKTCPAGDVALMADIAGMEAEAWTCRAVAAQYTGTKGEKVAQALGKSLLLIGAAIESSGAHAGQMAIETSSYFIRCILC
jgi:DNA-binding transcriptional regulator YdaS (Cro superfamily)